MAAVLFGVLHIMPEWSQGSMLWRLLRLMAVSDRGYRGLFARLLWALK